MSYHYQKAMADLAMYSEEDEDSPFSSSEESSSSFEDTDEEEYPPMHALVRREPTRMLRPYAGNRPWRPAMNEFTINHRDLNRAPYREPAPSPPPAPKCDCCGTEYYDGHDEDKPEKCYRHRVCMREGDWIRHFQKEFHRSCPLRDCEKAPVNFVTRERFMQHWRNKHPDKCWFWETRKSKLSFLSSGGLTAKRVQFTSGMRLDDIVAGHMRT